MDGPLALDELLARTYEILGGNTTLYTDTEVCENGLNPAQNLLVLLNPALLTRRTAVEIVAQQAFIDLRQSAPRTIRLQRIVLGNVTTDDPTRSLGTVQSLTPVDRRTLQALSPQWFTKTGVPKHWYLHGRHLVGLYTRAAVACTLTLIYTALPTPFDSETPTQTSDLPPAIHPVIAEVGAALLLVKEGIVETTRAIQRLSQQIGEEHLTALHQALTRLTRQQRATQARLEAHTASEVPV